MTKSRTMAVAVGSFPCTITGYQLIKWLDGKEVGNLPRWSREAELINQ